VGGDGWAYDIGFGGLDHVIATGHNVNVLVLDTQVYSNTGGQKSKATPLGAAAKFAAEGNTTPKKDLGREMLWYGNAYVAQVALGANMNQTVRALREAEAHRGPSLVIAYSPCIAHGYDLSQSAAQQKRMVSSGVWPLYRFDPSRIPEGKPPLQMDSGTPDFGVRELMQSETRFRMVEKSDPERFKHFVAEVEDRARRNHALYQQFAEISVRPSSTWPGE
jgi:pyruvate-ferredoxin/flavodoxin oxidoreductase